MSEEFRHTPEENATDYLRTLFARNSRTDSKEHKLRMRQLRLEAILRFVTSNGSSTVKEIATYIYGSPDKTDTDQIAHLVKNYLTEFALQHNVEFKVGMSLNSRFGLEVKLLSINGVNLEPEKDKTYGIVTSDPYLEEVLQSYGEELIGNSTTMAFNSIRRPLYLAGSAANSLYFVKKGHALLSTVSLEGEEIGTNLASDWSETRFFGFESVLPHIKTTGMPQNAITPTYRTGATNGPGSEIIKIPASTIINLVNAELRQHTKPVLFNYLLSQVAKATKFTEHHFGNQRMNYYLEDQIWNYLQYIQQRHSINEITMAVEELGILFGSRRESTQRVLAKLQRKKMISINKGTISFNYQTS